MIPGAPKRDIDSCIDLVKSRIKVLIKDQLNEMQSAKVIIILWVRWKKPVKLTITLGFQDVEDAQDVGGDACDNYIRVEMSFNRLITEFFEDGKTGELTRHIFGHIKTEVAKFANT